jgi:hypothetical protein
MADDIRILTTLPHHPKLLKLRRKLGADGCWHLIKLWLWVADNRPDGGLSGLSDEDLELAIEWSGPVSLIACLREVHFLDGDPGNSAVHDWLSRQPWVTGRTDRVRKAQVAASARWAKTPPEERSAVAKRLNKSRWNGSAPDQTQAPGVRDTRAHSTDSRSDTRAQSTDHPCPPPNPTPHGPDPTQPDPTVGRKNRDVSPENGDVPRQNRGADPSSVSDTNSENFEMVDRLGARELKGLKTVLERTLRDRRMPAAYRESIRQKLNHVASLLRGAS